MYADNSSGSQLYNSSNVKTRMYGVWNIFEPKKAP